MLGRRSSKTLYQLQDSLWEKSFFEQYLYCGQDEIGACSESGQVTQFRALGKGKCAEIGASVAIELQNQIYFPLHDFFGNVACLLSQDGEIVESTRFSAFGLENPSSSSINPWRFASKRFDPESGFIFFGKRYYIPGIGRWTTLDPEGFRDGPNLYAYVHNSPLTHFDPYGLFAEKGGRHTYQTFQRKSFAKSLFTKAAQEGFKGAVAGATLDLKSGFIDQVTSDRTSSWEHKAELGVGMVMRSAGFVLGSIGIGEVCSFGMRSAQLAYNSYKTVRMAQAISLEVGVVKGGRNLTRTSIKEYLQNAKKLSPSQISKDLESLGFKAYKSPDGRFMKFLDKRGNLRAKIHPPDKATSSNHLHIYDKSGRPLNSELKSVDYR